MKAFKELCNYAIFTVLAVFAFKAFQICYPDIELALEMRNFKFDTIMYLCNCILAVTLTGASVIGFALKALVSIILAFYYGLFYNDRCTRMQIKIDENDRIKESYIELKNGDIIPVLISKIVADKHVEFEENSNE